MLPQLLLSSCLLGLALATGHYGVVPQASCHPKRETIDVTRTNVETIRDQVTIFDFQYGHHTLDVTSFIFRPSTHVVTNQFTDLTRPQVSTRTRYITATVYQNKYETSLATVVATQTSQVFASAVDVTAQTITQTAVVPETVTQIATVASLVTATRTISVTSDVVNSLVLVTEIEPVLVGITTYQTVPVFATLTVTSSSDVTVEATVTLTQHEYVTMCYDPEITYDH